MAQYNPIELEKKILKFWEDNRLVEKSLELNMGKKVFSFIDGPPTANNPMGVHHAWGRTYKDLYLRYRTMQGFDVRKQPGFDCQGLWVEVGVEKELGLKTKKDIETYGIDKFSDRCKENVLNYVKIWIKLSKQLGMWMDWSNPYLTMTDENIQYVWLFLKKCFENGWLYKGFKVLPWCPRCGTSLSQHEVSSGYQQLTHVAIYLKFPVKDRKNEFFLVWTTTPWTLPADVALAVHPDLTYVRVKQNDETYILCKDLLSCLGDEYEIIKEMRGKDLNGMEFVALMDELPLQKGFKHRVVLSEIVSGAEGTGIVHIAPGHGPEDFEIGKQHNLPVLSPIDEYAVFDKTTGWLEGKNTKEANKLVLKSLEERGLIYKRAEITHSYPCCWRCKEELVYRTGEEWFIMSDGIKNKLIEEAKKIVFYPEWAQKSMLDWLKNLRDWNISRKRYFGLPLPFWCCENGHMKVVGSIKELKERAIGGLEGLRELHRPWIDGVVLKCEKCGKEMKRILDTGDCWLDAGVVPFSTLDYAGNKKHWERWFPADFITEMHEQVRLWFYSMLFISTTLVGAAPYRSVLAHGMVLDENKREMHKSWGNVIWADEGLNRIGADVMRWMYCSQNPGLSLPFGYTPAKDVVKVLNVLFNTADYVKTYCEANAFKPEKIGKLDVESRWIFSRLESLKQDVTSHLDELKPHLATRELEDFFLNDLSRWYIHIIRSKIKPGVDSKDKQTALYTLYTVMLDMLKLLAPFIPFITEELYQNYFRKFENRESIHFMEWPKADKTLIDCRLEKDMKMIKSVVEACYAARQVGGLKIRWPIKRLTIVSGHKRMEEILKTELKEILLSLCNTKTANVVKKKPEGEFHEADFVFGKVLVDKELDKELLDEALLRELIRKIQTMRKEHGFHIKERILLTLSSDDATNKILEKFADALKKEVGGTGLSVKKLKGKCKGSMEFEKTRVDIAFDKE